MDEPKTYTSLSGFPAPRVAYVLVKDEQRFGGSIGEGLLLANSANVNITLIVVVGGHRLKPTGGCLVF